MARDVAATCIQGPDNGTGNPIPVTATIGANSSVNLNQVGGAAVTTNAAGQQLTASNLVQVNGVTAPGSNGNVPVELRTSTNVVLVAVQADAISGNALEVVQAASVPVNQVSATNASNTITIGAVASKSNRLTHLSFYFIGNNTAQTVTVSDGGGTIWRFDLPANANSLINAGLPAGGIRCAINSSLAISIPAGGAATNSVINMAYQQY
jgi:hypothetical protein